MTSLAERLGYRADDRVIIINCDDLGSSQAANDAVYRALRDGVASSATLMVPAPWARHAAAEYRGEDVGVHLTLNSQWDLYRWGPITRAPSLLDGDGGFPRTATDVWDHADLDEVRRELTAQVERAILWGFDVTHLDSHMGTLQLKPEFFDVYLDLALEYALPLRLSGAATQQAVGFPFRDRADEEGVVAPDHLVRAHQAGSRPQILAAMGSLQPGVTEMYVHPAVDTPELRGHAPDWEGRVDDLDLVSGVGVLAERLRQAGAHVIGYRPLRELQRAG